MFGNDLTWNDALIIFERTVLSVLPKPKRLTPRRPRVSQILPGFVDTLERYFTQNGAPMDPRLQNRLFKPSYASLRGATDYLQTVFGRKAPSMQTVYLYTLPRKANSVHGLAHYIRPDGSGEGALARFQNSQKDGVLSVHRLDDHSTNSTNKALTQIGYLTPGETLQESQDDKKKHNLCERVISARNMLRPIGAGETDAVHTNLQVKVLLTGFLTLSLDTPRNLASDKPSKRTGFAAYVVRADARTTEHIKIQLESFLFALDVGLIPRPKDLCQIILYVDGGGNQTPLTPRYHKFIT